MSENEKIKVLFRHRSMEMGGVEKVILSMLNNLNPDKFDITVCLNLNQGELKDEFPHHVKKVYLADGKESFSQNALIHKFQLIRRRLKLSRALKDHKISDRILGNKKFDIEIAPTYAAFSSVINSSNKDSKKIGWFHSEINVPGMKPLVPDILENFPQFDHMIYCSQKIKDIMHQSYPDLQYPAETVVINAIPIEEIKKKAEEKIEDFPQEGPVFVSVGRLHNRKGYHKLIDAHKKLIDEGFHHRVVVIGNGEEMKNLTQQILNNNVQETFILCGNRMNPYPYIKKADYFILSSESEAWPLVIAEALILQKPIIATDTGDVGVMIKDRETGYLINYDTNEMYEAMKTFLTDQELISHIRKNLETIEDQFDNQKIFNAVESIINDLYQR
ncbi:MULTISPECIES: glycosyltransferase [Chryseobacterium]|uniref:Glycosyltransferase n=1 Tax=Chryseobacterium rhizosphaerae TaxID=395937 RepID=A0ABX9IQA1_9FLAO|nr:MULTISPECIES: glycosyltransferase [Chryseobacterium]MDC8102107.1 glycosyltransferase [Chryseobacterium rhizosphaerae]REC78191.1 glycosyltransferase [Chryseobacterium rhizosphaerae]GEN68919.1 glycosyl transferase [Chryseobacterium rhizosphaerae]SMC77268.1 Glycosyltransferase involved in cell wall bisynthesis [Chryseobacterium sp. YR221]